MSTAGNVLTALTHRQPNKEDKLPSRAEQISFFWRGWVICVFVKNKCLVSRFISGEISDI